MPAFVAKDHPRYKWIALSNTTLGVLMAVINSSIVIISLPAIFKGIDLNPLAAGNVSYLLWMLMGYMLITAVLVVTFGRLGDMYGRVRIYNAGFVVFTIGSIALAFDPYTGGTGAMWLIIWRLVQGIGGAMLFANSTAILTDAFPSNKRGMALGINQVAAIAGSFIGLIVGGLLSTIDWRAVFFVSVPIGIIGTIWSYKSLHEVGVKNKGKLDWPGNIVFAVGLTALLAAITYGIQPYGSSATGWGNPWVLAGIIGGIVLLVVFVFMELHSKSPMFEMRLFKIRSFSMAILAGLLASIGRGGLQFMLIIWLQGIWLPLHGYSYEDTPLWAGIYLIPLTVGFLIAGPISGTLSDRFGAKGFATGGLVLVALTFVGLLLLPVNFSYLPFAVITFLSGVGSGMFGAPNRASIMNSVPANQRGSASGMAGTVQNAGTSLSIGVFFSLMIAGLSTTLPSTLKSGLASHGVSTTVATQISQLPPVSTLFSAFLGFNPIQELLGSKVLSGLSSANRSTLVGKEFFPQLISAPFHHGLVVVFTAATIMTVIAAIASLVRGKKFVHLDLPTGSVDIVETGEDGQTEVVPSTSSSSTPVTASNAVRDS
ncbi:MFS transporter [Frondihabitans australicus]|uniref:EmrB/QacA subfamily drug resistance transporter n=1 Tax=Frondihabitans australicus TaxID=386892 RepID=A0A495IDC4_9MICO|nr:MFS transporter [Frondihabitans australicus]RKR73962.1 EmrB/QacA subfamily drug resistance transporter [Frondihabitans australicus]